MSGLEALAARILEEQPGWDDGPAGRTAGFVYMERAGWLDGLTTDERRALYVLLNVGYSWGVTGGVAL